MAQAQAQTLALQPFKPTCGPFVELWQSFPSQTQGIAPFLERLMRCIDHIEITSPCLREKVSDSLKLSQFISRR